MNLATQCARAAYPPRMKILGVGLQPYCLGHEWLLQRFNSPFAMEGERREPGLGDLALGMGICARDWEAATRWVEGWRCRRALKRKPCVNVWTEEALFRFHWHVLSAQKFPPFSRKSGGEALGAPLIISIQYSLAHHWHCDESEAMNMPLGKALWKHLTALEQHCPVRIAAPMAPEKLKAAQELAKKLHSEGLQQPAPAQNTTQLQPTA